MGTQPEVTTVTENPVVKNTDEYPNQMDSLTIAAAHARAYNVGKLKGVVDKYQEKMVKMKETLMKERGEG